MKNYSSIQLNHGNLYMLSNYIVAIISINF